MSGKPLPAPERVNQRAAAGRCRIVSVIGCFPIHEDDASAGWAVGHRRPAEARRAFVCMWRLLPASPRQPAACEVTS